MNSRLLIAVLFASAAGACTKDQTQIIVRVDSNFAVPNELDHIAAVVFADDGTTVKSSHDFQLPSEVSIPFSFGVAHDDGSGLDVTIELQAQHGSDLLYTRRVNTHFVEGKSLLLAVYLAKECSGVPCEANQSCDFLGCVPDTIDQLPEIEPGGEQGFDGGYPPVNPNRGGFVIDPLSGLETTESGGTAMFTVALDRQPETFVSVEISTNNPNEGSVDTAKLTFTALDWDTPQTVVAHGIDDTLADGNRTFRVVLAPATSDDPRFVGANPPDVEITNLDDDVAAIELIGALGLSTSERGTTASFGVQLSAEPIADVTIEISSAKPQEGTVDTPSITITPARWTETFMVTVRGVDDGSPDGPQIFDVVVSSAHSADPTYAALADQTVQVINQDDETAGVTITPSNLTVDESGSTAFFSVVLNTAPHDTVTIDFTSGNLAEGTVSPSRIMFQAGEGNLEQEVTVTGVDDDVDDDDVPFTIAVEVGSSDPDYAGLIVPPIDVTNVDDDTAAIIFSSTAGLVTTEAGTQVSFEIYLASRPTDDVTLNLASDNTNEGTVDPEQIVFTAMNWDQHVPVLVTGVDDAAQDGAVVYSILIAPAVSLDSKYSQLDPEDVEITNSDNDTAGVTIAPVVIDVTEAAQPQTFVVFLNTAPTDDVTFSLTSEDTSEATVMPQSLTFTPGNWSTARTITVTSVDDPIDDGDVTFHIVTGPTMSGDPAYMSLDPPDVTVTSFDNDTAAIVVTPSSGLRTTEAGGTATFTMRLATQPTADVSVAISSNDPSEGTVAPSSLTFTSASYGPQTVTVTGVDDQLADGDVAYAIHTMQAVSMDPNYNGRNVSNVSVVNQDNDIAGISFDTTGPLYTTESGGTATFGVALNTQPAAHVTLNFSVLGSEGLLMPSSLTFTMTNWSTRQTVMVTGVDDNALDGDATYPLVTLPSMSADPNYNNVVAPDLTVVNADDGALVNPAPLTTVPSNGATSRQPVVSANGMLIAFESNDPSLVANDGNNAGDIFVFDRHTLSISRVSVATNGGDPNAESHRPAISADGRYVVFESEATNLVPGDTNGVLDVFLRDRMLNTTTRVSFDVLGMQSTLNSMNPSISSDGRYVVYVVESTMLSLSCIQVFDRMMNLTLISGTGASCAQPSISTDGRWVAYESGSRAVGAVVRLYDRMLGTQSEPAAGFLGNSQEPWLSPDGRYLVVAGEAMIGPPLGYDEAYISDLTAGGFELLSVNAMGQSADGNCGVPHLSDDGNFVIFTSGAQNLGGSPPGASALYLRDRAGSTTSFFSPGSDGYPKLSGDGRFVVFAAPTFSGGNLIYLMSR